MDIPTDVIQGVGIPSYSPSYALNYYGAKIPVVHRDAGAMSRVLLPCSLASKALSNGNHPLLIALLRLAKDLLGKANCVAGVQLLPHVAETPTADF